MIITSEPIFDLCLILFSSMVGTHEVNMSNVNMDCIKNFLILDNIYLSL